MYSHFPYYRSNGWQIVGICIKYDVAMYYKYTSSFYLKHLFISIKTWQEGEVLRLCVKN
jgi:hypothetical protein